MRYGMILILWLAACVAGAEPVIWVQVDAWAIGEGLGTVVKLEEGPGAVTMNERGIESWGLAQPKPESWPSVEDAKATVAAYDEPGNASNQWWNSRSHFEKCMIRVLYQHEVDEHGYSGTIKEYAIAKLKPQWDKDK